jgi:mRNA interferase RelE/StbE
LVWSIEYSRTALKQLGKLDRQVASKLIHALENKIALTGLPRSTGKALTGPDLNSYWRYRVDDYRIICDIQDERVCILVITIGHRNTFTDEKNA